MPDTPIPTGCLIGFFGLLASAFSAFSFWGASKAFGQTLPKTEIGNEFILWGIIVALPAIACIVCSLYRISTAGKRDYYRIGRSLST